MSFTNRIGTNPRRQRALALSGALVAVVALAASGSAVSASGGASAVGQPPPEWAASAGQQFHHGEWSTEFISALTAYETDEMNCLAVDLHDHNRYFRLFQKSSKLRCDTLFELCCC